MCVCVCVCVREREREVKRVKNYHIEMKTFNLRDFKIILHFYFSCYKWPKRMGWRWSHWSRRLVTWNMYWSWLSSVTSERWLLFLSPFAPHNKTRFLSSEQCWIRFEKNVIIDKFKQHEILLFVCYSTQKSNIGTVVGLENIF